MRTADLLRGYKHADPEIQEMLEAVAEHAYAAGKRDQSAEMFSMALETDERVRAVLDVKLPPDTVLN